MNQSSTFGPRRSRLTGNSPEAAKRFVIERVESTGAATQDDFDIDLIVSTAHKQINDWDFQAMPSTAFWRIVSSNLRL